MLIIPAIDIRGGKVVRLLRGAFDSEKVYYSDPLEVALKWQKDGAEIIHIVDLDGSKEGTTVNKKLILKICNNISIPIEVGGGIRTIEDIRDYLSEGIARVIIGTKAIDNIFFKNVIKEFGEKIVIGIDAVNGKVALKGWEEVSTIDAINLAKIVEESGGKRIIFTDISRDGTLSSPNFNEIKKVASSVTIPIIASGGISSIKDIENLLQIDATNIEGAIIGKALYEGIIDLKEAIKFAKERSNIILH